MGRRAAGLALDLVRVRRVGRSDAAFVIFAIEPRATDIISAARRLFSHDLVRAKNMPTGHLNANRMPFLGSGAS